MRRLLYYEQTFLFYFLVLFLGMTFFSQIEFRTTPSYPLTAQSGPESGAGPTTQKDGGFTLLFSS